MDELGVTRIGDDADQQEGDDRAQSSAVLLMPLTDATESFSNRSAGSTLAIVVKHP